MKILHLLYESEGDYFGVGGVAVRAYEKYKRIKERHEITLLCKRYKGAKDGYINGFNHIFVGSETTNLRDSLLSYGFKSAEFLKQNGNNYDLIIDEFSPAIPSFSHLFTKRPIILQVQGYTDYHYFRKYDPLSATFLFLSEKIRPKFYENFIVISQNTTKRLSMGKYKNLLVLPNGIDPSLLENEYCDGEYILYLGRIDYYAKGLDVLLYAFKEVCKQFPQIKLIIAGDGRDKEMLYEEINKLSDKVKNNIITTGWISGKDKIDVIKKAMFYILPSRHETQGITLLEAMAFKKALIVSDIPELDYAVGCGAAVNFKSGSYKSLAERILEYITNTHMLKQKGITGFEWVKDFTWDKISEKYEEFLAEVIKKTKD
ncbi:MAG: glycosyltransferase family 4 protein [Thermodesulfovibrionales bacterium]|nr:glycosyltransferase family 4 protein [Thermodesulfovibrionales bacterium]